jgi:hypothetical protein
MSKVGTGLSTSSKDSFLDCLKGANREQTRSGYARGARRALLADEKAWTREWDRLSERRRALPWVKSVVTKRSTSSRTAGDGN